MTISSPRAIDAQLVLFDDHDDVAITGFAVCRNLVGEFFECATAKLLRARRLKTEARKLCPDSMLNDYCYAESKGVGRTRHAIFYDHRIAKYDDVLMREMKCELLYCIWMHDCRADKAGTTHELHRQLASQTKGVVVLAAQHVHDVALQQKQKRLNTKTKTPAGKRLGWGTNGYGIGRSLHVRLLRERASACITIDELLVGRSRFERLRVECDERAFQLLTRSEQ